MNHSTEAIHHSCAMNHVIQFQSHRTWISTLEIQSQPFIFSRPGGIGYIFLKGQKQYFRRGNHTSPSQLLDSATIAQRQPRQYRNKWVWLCPNKTEFTVTDIWISYVDGSLKSPFDFISTI